MDKPKTKVIGILNIPIGMLNSKECSVIETSDFHNFNDEVLYREGKTFIAVDNNYQNIIDKLKSKTKFNKNYFYQSFNFESEDHIETLNNFIQILENEFDTIIIIGYKLIKCNLDFFDEISIKFTEDFKMTNDINDFMNIIREKFELSISKWNNHGEEYQLFTKKV